MTVHLSELKKRSPGNKAGRPYKRYDLIMESHSTLISVTLYSLKKKNRSPGNPGKEADFMTCKYAKYLEDVFAVLIQKNTAPGKPEKTLSL